MDICESRSQLTQLSSSPACEVRALEALAKIMVELKEYVIETRPSPEVVLDCATQFFLIRQGINITLSDLKIILKSESTIVSDSPNNMNRIQFHKNSESSTSGGNVLSPKERQPGPNSNTELEADSFTTKHPAAHHGLFLLMIINAMLCHGMYHLIIICSDEADIPAKNLDRIFVSTQHNWFFFRNP